MVETDVTTIKLTGLAPNTQVRADTQVFDDDSDEGKCHDEHDYHMVDQ